LFLEEEKEKKEQTIMEECTTYDKSIVPTVQKKHDLPTGNKKITEK
jgi:hypothetical protein